MAAMKAMLERLVKESEEREVRITVLEEKITRLTKKMEKWPTRSSTKNSESEDEEKASIQSEHSDEKIHSKKGGQFKNNGSPSSMTAEQIQQLVANAVKAQLGGNVHKTHLYTKPYTKTVDALYMSRGYQSPKFQQFDGKGKPKHHVAHFIKTCNPKG